MHRCVHETFSLKAVLSNHILEKIRSLTSKQKPKYLSILFLSLHPLVFTEYNMLNTCGTLIRSQLCFAKHPSWQEIICVTSLLSSYVFYTNISTDFWSLFKRLQYLLPLFWLCTNFMLNFMHFYLKKIFKQTICKI